MHRRGVRIWALAVFVLALFSSLSTVTAEEPLSSSTEEYTVSLRDDDPCDATFRRLYGPDADCMHDDFAESEEMQKLRAIMDDHDETFVSGAYGEATEDAIERIEALLQFELDERVRGEIEAYLAQMHRERAAQLVEHEATFETAMNELEAAGGLYESAADSFESAGKGDASNTAEVLAGNTFLSMAELSSERMSENLKKAEVAYQSVLSTQTEKRDPRLSAAALGLAQAAITKGDLEKAMEFLDTAERFDASNPHVRQLRNALKQGSTIAALKAIKEGYAVSTQKNLDAFEDFWGMKSPVMGLVQQGLEKVLGVGGYSPLALERDAASQALDQLVRTKNNENADIVVALTFMEGFVRKGYSMQDIHAMNYEQRTAALQEIYAALTDRRAKDVAFRIGKSFENGDVAKLTRLVNEPHKFFASNPSFDYTGNAARAVVDEIAIGRSVYNVQNVLGAVFAVEGAGMLLSQSYARAGLTFVTRASTDKALAWSFGAGVAEGFLYSNGVVIGSKYVGKQAVAAGAPQWVANDLHGAGDIASNMLTFSPLNARIVKWQGGKMPELKLEEKGMYLLGERNVFEGIKAKTAREKANIERELVNQGWEKVHDPTNSDISLLRPKLELSPGGGVPARRPEIVLYHGDAPATVKGESIAVSATREHFREVIRSSAAEQMKRVPVVIEGNPAVRTAVDTRARSTESAPLTRCATGCDGSGQGGSGAVSRADISQEFASELLSGENSKIVLPDGTWAPAKAGNELLSLWSDIGSGQLMTGYNGKGVRLEELLNQDPTASAVFREILFSHLPSDTPTFIGTHSFYYKNKAHTIDMGGLPEKPYTLEALLMLPEGASRRTIQFDWGGPRNVDGGWIHTMFRHGDPHPDVHRAAVIFSTPPRASQPMTGNLFVRKVEGKIVPYKPQEIRNSVEKSLTDLTLKKNFVSRLDGSHVYEFESFSNNMHITFVEKNGILRFNSAFLINKPTEITNGEWRRIQKGEYFYDDGEIILNH